MQTFKLFVSSPGDVMVERRRVESVVSRLNGEFAGVARLEAVRWETEFYQAYSTFQAQIPRSTDCDIVVGILRWRLGTELPPDFAEKLPGDQPFPSGTAYEILTAIAQRQQGGPLPDVYVFRFGGSSPAVPVDDPNRVKIERDWAALKGFFEQWFLTARGHFKAAFNQYESEDDFEAQLEKLLRKWIADKVAGGRVVRWPVAVKGSPFCGLAAFGAKHKAVFFGRNSDVVRAVDLWREAGSRGSPYLLIVGASGSGKSSLARAGVVPRLSTPGVIKDVDAWRVAVMRPGDSPAGPFAALAMALLQDEAALPKEEEGRGPALPEIAQGDSRTPAELASVLQYADAAAVKPIVNALSRVGAGEHDRERYGREVRCDLVLLIDQFEELFAGSVSETERSGFINLMAELAATGRIWIAVTLRADFYARMLDQPALKKLKELGATYDLAPPGPVELAEIVRAPAEAAGLVFETDAASGERLDARLLRDADRPDMLPLVQLALSRLFEGRETVGNDIMLPLQVYDSLGGLKGIVNEAGERALASAGDAAIARLPLLLRQLAVPAHDQDGAGKGALTVRSVPLTLAATDEPGRKLVNALIDARLLTTTGTAADAQVRLTHQRVLEDWSRARTVVAESADFYRIRDELEESRRKWQAGKQRSELLLARGLPLAEALNVVGKYGGELTPEVLAYVSASRRRALRAQTIGWAAAAFFFVLAVGATGAGMLAYREQQIAIRAQQQAAAALAAATQTANSLVYDLVQRFENVMGVPVALIKDILDKARTLQEQLIKSGQVTPDLKRSEAAALIKTVDILLTIGDTDGALAAAQQARQIMNDLFATDPGSTDYQIVRDVAYERVGKVQEAQGKYADALVSYQASLAITEGLAKSDPGNVTWQRELAICYRHVGDMQKAQEKFADALISYQADRSNMQRLATSDPGNAGWQRDLSVTYSEVGDVQVAQGKLADALASYGASLAIAKRLAQSDPGNAGWQRDLADAHRAVGDVQMAQGKLADALKSYEAARALWERLAQSDPGNAGWQRELAVIYNEAGDVQVGQSRRADALASYQMALAIMDRLVKSNPGNTGWQMDLSGAYDKVGDIQVEQGKLADALVSYQSELAIAERLAKSDAGNANRQHALSVSYYKVGDVQMMQGTLADALQSYQSSLGIDERLTKSNPDNPGWQSDLAFYYAKVGAVQLAQGKLGDALTSYQGALAVRERLAKSDPGNADWQQNLSVSYYKVGDVQMMQGKLADALQSYRSSLGITERLTKSNPDNTGWQSDLAFYYEKAGAVQVAQGKLDDALTSYQESLAVRERLAKSDPGNADRQHELSVVYENVGDVQVKQGKLGDALASYQASLVIAERLAKSDPGNADRQRAMSVLYQNIADVQVKQGNLGDALTSYQANLAIAEHLATSDPGNADRQQNLSFAYYKVGDVQLTQGKLADALQSYQSSLGIDERLTKSNPNNTGWQSDLAFYYEKVGAVQVAQGKLGDALTSYQASLAVRERLAKSDPGNAEWQRNLSIAYEEVGNAQLKQGKSADALPSYRASFAIAERLAKSDPGNADWQHDLSVAYLKVGDAEVALGKLADALLSYRDSSALIHRLLSVSPNNKAWQDELGALSYHFLMGHDFANALQAADRAISLEPDQLWIYTNRAHALMFLGRIEEARALYLKYRGQIVPDQDGKIWQAIILDDFAQLRKSGLANPLMDEIERLFASAG